VNRKKIRRDYRISVEPDGRFMHPPAGNHTVEKHQRLGIYAELLATGMKNKWDQRVFIDLFTGPGHCRLKETGNVVLGSPLVSLSLPHLFDRYVFCENTKDALTALKERVSQMNVSADVRYVAGDINDWSVVADVIKHLPSPEMKALYLCFVDPYSLEFKFSTIKQMADARRMDFIVNLAFGTDGKRNLRKYYTRDGSLRIEELLNDTEWRVKWEASGQSESEFLAERFSKAMEEIGYQPVSFERMYPVKSTRGSMLYYLAFYTKDSSGRANDFWTETLKYTDVQLRML